MNDQLWFHHPEMQARVRVAEAELAEGRSTRTDTPEAAQAFLDSLKSATDYEPAPGATAPPHGGDR